ncbi:MAG: ArnT family glycosyltransferase [Bradymonadia bacterium]
MRNSESRWLTAPTRLAQDRLVVGALLLALLALYMPNLGGYGLYDPWETHYGEVARNMVETGNYIDPFWGAPWDPNGVKRERAGFYSKPPLTMWLMAAGMNIAGYNEWGVRLLFPVLAIMALLAIYLAVSRLKHRRAGLIAVTVTGTIPFYTFLSRQAVTDGPMVSLMVLAAMALGLGLFACEDDDSPPSPALYWGTLTLAMVVMLGQLWAMLPMDRSPDTIRPYPGDGGFFIAIQWFFRDLFWVGRGKGWVIALVLMPLAVFTALRIARQRRRQMLYIYLFYIFVGLVVPAKGWVAWAPLGGAIVGYLLITGEWHRLKQVDIPGGLLIVFMTGHPWIIAMLGGHHPGWYNRFVVHDHYKRLFEKVHSTDDGAFEYFVKWIGYGLFPWIGLLPAAIARMVGLRKGPDGYTKLQKFEIFIFVWAIFGFMMFSKSGTKFHHYIFPAIPPLCILLALALDDLIDRAPRGASVLLMGGALITVWVGQDLYRMPTRHGEASQNLVNLFTYKYDREWPEYTPPEELAEARAALATAPDAEGPDVDKKDKPPMTAEQLAFAEEDNAFLFELSGPLFWMTWMGAIGLGAMALFGGWIREYGGVVVALGGLWCAMYCLHTYLPVVSHHWSQKGMWDTYYSQCTPFEEGDTLGYRQHMLGHLGRVPKRADMFPRVKCKEPIIAFRTNWRGETFYSANTTLPVIETKFMKQFFAQWGEHQPFYLFTERSRVKSELEPNLPKHLKGKGQEVFGANRKFVLFRFDPPPASQ